MAMQFEVHLNQITEWKRQLLDQAADAFGGGEVAPPVDLAPLDAYIGTRPSPLPRFHGH